MLEGVGDGDFNDIHDDGGVVFHVGLDFCMALALDGGDYFCPRAYRLRGW